MRPRQQGKSIFVGIIHDLSDRKRTEAQLTQAQKMEAVGQLSGGIAHDFNNLLTVIIGNAELLGNHLTARPDLQQFSDSIIVAGERGAELTKRLLAFSRRQTLQPATIDVNALIEGMGKLLARALRDDVQVATSLATELLPAYADASQLESAILNLAINSQDAMPNGGLLTISTANSVLDQSYAATHQEVTPGSYVAIVVTDNGHGMPPEVRDRAFDPFFTTKDVGKGSGLGLSMVYGFVKQSNGHIAIYSEVGLGTAVRIYLPAGASDGAVVPNAPAADEVLLPGGHETILVAEDDPFVRGYAVACLESLGYKVITAVDGRDALDRLRQGAEPDVLFTDVVMPGGISGWELARQAQSERPGLKVLLTSGYPLETLKEHERPRAGFILNKPYRKNDLAKRLREVLDAPNTI